MRSGGRQAQLDMYLVSKILGCAFVDKIIKHRAKAGIRKLMDRFMECVCHVGLRTEVDGIIRLKVEALYPRKVPCKSRVIQFIQLLVQGHVGHVKLGIGSVDDELTRLCNVFVAQLILDIRLKKLALSKNLVQQTRPLHVDYRVGVEVQRGGSAG